MADYDTQRQKSIVYIATRQLAKQTKQTTPAITTITHQIGHDTGSHGRLQLLLCILFTFRVTHDIGTVEGKCSNNQRQISEVPSQQ